MYHQQFSIYRLGAICSLLCMISPSTHAEPASPRERISFNAGWSFRQGDPDGTGSSLSYATIKDAVIASASGFVSQGKPTKEVPANLGSAVSYTRPDFDDHAWRKLDLPHDWGVEGQFTQEYPGETGKLPWWGVAWYRKHFDIDAKTTGQRTYLQIDGAMSYSTVWLNGNFVGGWPYGYASYQLDLTPYLKAGGNVISIRLDNPRQSSRWYPGGGIYRNVWLLRTNPVHVAHWSTAITTPSISGGQADVRISRKIENLSAAPASVMVTTGIRLGTQMVATVSPARLSLAPGQTLADTASLVVRQPKLWNIETPYLYTAVTTILRDGRVIDHEEIPFGIRSIEFTKDNGFLLNGKRVKLQGVCQHHDLGALGSAINYRGLERQVEILKEMGVNAIRTSHNPPAPELLDICDRKGVVVMDESFDCWVTGKNSNDYSVLFPDWHENDMSALVRRDRNHPCVVLWSIGNEIPDQGKRQGPQLAAMLRDITRREDPTRPVTSACDRVASGYNDFRKGVDVFGYNYKPNEYGKFHAANPAQPLIGSETSSCVTSRGEYFFPVGGKPENNQRNFQVSSYDLFFPSWATTPDTEFFGQDKNPFVSGEFVWTGFDYLGEPTPYNSDMTNLSNFSDPAERERMKKELEALGKIKVPSRSSYFGIVDLAGFRKDRFYIYQARWRPELPMAHILPHWNWPDRVGQVTPVHVYTSGDEAELFLNGKSLGRKKRGAFEYRLHWDDVVYQPGVLQVVAYRNGKRWAIAEMRTTDAAEKITLSPDRAQIRGDGNDLSYITATIADKNGLLVPRSKNRVEFTVEGPGEIVATDNGDATSFESFQSPKRNAFNGIALVIVRAKPGQTGAIKLTAKSDGLAGASVIVNAK
jgi:beta-galactosidase